MGNAGCTRMYVRDGTAFKDFTPGSEMRWLALVAIKHSSRWVMKYAHRPAWAAMLGNLLLSGWPLTAIGRTITHQLSGFQRGTAVIWDPLSRWQVKYGIGASPPTNVSVFGERGLAEDHPCLGAGPGTGPPRTSPRSCQALLGRQTAHSFFPFQGQCWGIDSGSPFQPLS